MAWNGFICDNCGADTSVVTVHKGGITLCDYCQWLLEHGKIQLPIKRGGGANVLP